MKYQASIMTRTVQGVWSFDWADLRVGPGLAETEGWEGAKTYAKRSRLPVRELDDKGLVTREFFPSIAYEGPCP